MIRLAIMAVLLCLGITGHAQQGFAVSYEAIGGKMRIKLYINDNPRYFIFDTGASRTGISGTLRDELGLPSANPVTITDAASVKQDYKACIIDAIHFGDKTTLVTGIMPFVVENSGEIFGCFDVSGIIGNDVISKFNIEIDSRGKTIRLFQPACHPAVSLRNMIKFEPYRHNMPIFNIGCGNGKTMKVLFDTGCSVFLSLLPGDFEMLREYATVDIKSEGVAYSSTGISVKTGIVDNYMVNIHHLDIALGKFRDITATTSPVPVSLLGLQLLDHGKVTIDYSLSRFYFEPYDKSSVAATQALWNAGLTAANGQLYIASLWGDLRSVANPGDRVLKIDGSDVPPVGFCDLLINGLGLLANKTEATLTVQSGDATVTMTIIKE